VSTTATSALTYLYPGAGAPLIDFIPETWERHTQGCIEKLLHNNPYYPFATCEEYKFTQCGMKRKGMKTYYDNTLKEENTALRFPSFNLKNGLQNLVASIPDNWVLGKWELHTLKHMRWNDYHQQPI